MKNKPYKTLFVFDTELGAWFDCFGTYDNLEMVDEVASLPFETKKKHIRVIATDGSAKALYAANDLLNHAV
jgi:hypothetical protein